MAADFKSHILSRDEKGLFGIPFKRLLLAGVCGGLSYTLLNLVLPGWSFALAAAATLLTITLTGQRGGIPLWQRLIYRLRGSLLLAAARQPQGFIAQVAQTLELPTELALLDGGRVFAAPGGGAELDLREWITYAHAREEDGLVFVDSPLKETADA